MPESFREYCTYQIERLGGAFPEFRFYKPGAIEELVNWLEAKANGDFDRAAGVITEATEFSEIPSISALNAIWKKLYDSAPSKEADPLCLRCGGSGWRSVVRNGYEAAARCCCGVPPLYDPGRALPIPPAEAAQMRRDTREFMSALQIAGATPQAVKAATVEDIEDIKRRQEANRTVRG